MLWVIVWGPAFSEFLYFVYPVYFCVCSSTAKRWNRRVCVCFRNGFPCVWFFGWHWCQDVCLSTWCGQETSPDSGISALQDRIWQGIQLWYMLSNRIIGKMGHVIAHMVGHWCLTTDPWVQSWKTSFHIHDGQSGIIVSTHLPPLFEVCDSPDEAALLSDPLSLSWGLHLWPGTGYVVRGFVVLLERITYFRYM